MYKTEIIAKSIPNGTVTLLDHTKMVINLGLTIANIVKSPDPNFKKELCVALILHDIGKCSKAFQTFINENGKLNKDEDLEIPSGKIKKDQTFVYHNTLSWAFAVNCIQGIGSVSKRHQPISSSILYHHTIKDSLVDENGWDITAYDIIKKIQTEDPDCLPLMEEIYADLCEYVLVNHSIDVCGGKDFNVITDPDNYNGARHLSEEILYPIVEVTKDYEINNIDFEKMSKASLIRAILVYSDRTISSGVYDNSRILKNDIKYMKNIYTLHTNVSTSVVPDYSKYDQTRFSSQAEIIKEIQESEVKTNILAACPGFGKTLMGLLFHFNNNKKTMWITPRTVIADSTYESIIRELTTMGVYDKVKVGLYYGNKFQKSNFCDPDFCEMEDCDILVIIIDAFLSRYSKNNMSTLLIDSYCGNVVFDEYHEFVCTEPLFAAFVNTVKTRKDYVCSNTLLLSASPINLNCLWGSSNIAIWNKLPIFGGTTKVSVKIKEYETILGVNDFIKPNSFTILPTVKTAQECYIVSKDEQDTLLIHANYTKSDREAIENTLYSKYGKCCEDTEKIPVIGTNIIGTGLDISAQVINDYCISPEETIQRCGGRSSRFCEYDTVEYNILNSSKIADKGIYNFIGKKYDKELRNLWYQLLREYDGQIINKKILYDLYWSFQKNNRQLIDRYLYNAYKKSVSELSFIRHKSGKTYVETEIERTGKAGEMSYRGENSSFYATVKLANGDYLEPIICDDIVFAKESSDNNKERYNFMLSTQDERFSFPNKQALKWGWDIKKPNDATKEKCRVLACRNDRPLLLCDFEYASDIGLHFIGE